MFSLERLYFDMFFFNLCIYMNLYIFLYFASLVLGDEL